MENRRQLWIVAIGRAVSLFGDEAALVALALRLQGSGSAPWTVAVLFVAGLFPLVVLAGPVGRLVDRANSRVLLLSSSIGQAGACLALAYASHYAAVLTLVAVLGCGEAVNAATWRALVPTIVGHDGVAPATAIMQSTRIAATVAAPALAGTLVGAFGTKVPLLVDAASYLAISLTAFVVRNHRHGSAASAEDARGGWLIVRTDPLLRALLALLCTFGVLGASVVVVEVYLIRETLHASPTWYGIALAAWGVGMLGGAVVGGRRLRSDHALASVMLAGTIGLSLDFVGFSLCRDIWQLLVLSVVGGVANTALNLGGTTLLTRRPAPEVRGRVAAVTGGAMSASLIAAYVLGGVGGAYLSPREIYFGAGLLGLVAPLLLGRALLRAAPRSPIARETDQAEVAPSSQAA